VKNKTEGDIQTAINILGRFVEREIKDKIASKFIIVGGTGHAFSPPVIITIKILLPLFPYTV
jgi:hypothetical protein